MKLITDLTNDSMLHELNSYYNIDEVVLFDIETTGFSASASMLYLIGCIYYEAGSFHMIQWFADSKEEESSILHQFFSFLSNYKYLIHYNGNGFDLPYLLQKCKAYQLPYNFQEIESIDLYKILNPYKKILKLTNLKQKTVEQYLNIRRDDLYSGGELIPVYLNYLNSPTNDARSLLLLHNHDDLEGMLNLIPVLSYRQLFQGNIHIDGLELSDYRSVKGSVSKEVIISFTLQHSVPKRIACSYQDIYLSVHKEKGKLKLKLYTDELKYFYPNYHDYYYLPNEDKSIHKSVAFYVDKDFKTKAKAANCYSRKTGHFLPQYEEIISPYFKIDYFDKTLYFEVTNDFQQNTAMIKSYVLHLLAYLQNTA